MLLETETRWCGSACNQNHGWNTDGRTGRGTWEFWCLGKKGSH